MDFVTAILAKPDSDLPSVITTSYGENEQTIPVSYAKTVCGMFGQLGARGVSIIFSSGDSGPGWSCKSNDGKGTKKFLPQVCLPLFAQYRVARHLSTHSIFFYIIR